MALDMELPFDIPERTQFTDDGYAVLGRALAVATEYEGNCRALAALLGLKAEPKLLDDKKMLNEFCEFVWRRRLNTNIDALKGKLKLRDEVVSKLHVGRDARNYVAHEAAVGARRILENDGERKHLVEELSEKLRKLAEANLIVLVISQAITNEPIPTAQFLQTYPEQIVGWVCTPDD